MRDHDIPANALVPVTDYDAARAVLRAALELLRESGWAPGRVAARDRRGAPCAPDSPRACLFAAGTACSRAAAELGYGWQPAAEAQRLLTRAIGASPARLNEIARDAEQVLAAYERALRLADHDEQQRKTQGKVDVQV